MIILGIDPGTATTGYGVIKKGKNQALSCLDYGLISTSPKLDPEQRLKKLYLELNQLISKYRPRLLAVEKIYFFKNLKTALPISEAKGVILLAAANKKIKIREFTPLQIKTALVGYGRAQKWQIQRMIQSILKLKEIPRPDDAADALALAICASF
jgi:crossover junction endodeoxyribonuclease RuvC